MTTVSSSENHLDDVLKLISLLAQKSASGDVIFRGEPRCYEKVSSNLHRQYQSIGADSLDIEVVQREILEEAKKYTSETDDLEILTQLQHFGGKTNLIDFTTDFLTALFFACDGYPDEDGRVVLLLRTEESGNSVFQPRNPANRVTAQKSIFVRPPKGFVEPDDTVVIPHALKHPLLNYLRTGHGITSTTIYNDLHGFIRAQQLHEGAYSKFYDGLALEINGQYRQAIEKYTEVLDLNPQIRAVFYHRSHIYLVQGDFSRAMQDFGTGRLLDQESPVAPYHRANWYFGRGDFDRAIEYASKIIELDPGNAELYKGRGNIYRENDKYDAAIQDYGKALAIAPDDYLAYYYRGETYRAKGDRNRAEQDYRRALELNPDFAPAYVGRGELQHQNHDYVSALRDFDRALDLDSMDVATYRHRGDTHWANRDLGRAIQDYDRAFGSGPHQCICLQHTRQHSSGQRRLRTRYPRP